MPKVLFLLFFLISCSGCVVTDAIDSAARTLSVVSVTTETFSDVSRLSPQRTFMVLLPQELDNDLEAQNYSTSVKKYLQAYGFILVNDLSDAELAVSFSYSTSGPYQTTEGGDEGVSLYVKYKRLFSVAILDVTTNANADVATVVYQSSATSFGGQKSFNVVSECLIKAMFRHFPDQNAKVRRQTLGAPNCMK